MLRTELIKPVPELLAQHAREQPDKPAFSDARRAVNYQELDERTWRLAGNLTAWGLQPGERIALYLDNSVETAESYLAATRAEAVGVCLDPHAADREVGHMLSDSGARALITDPTHLPTASAMAADQPGLELVLCTGGETSHSTGEMPSVRSYEEFAASNSAISPPDDPALDAAAWMLYTSGTTGRPKGVLLSQRSCLWVVAACWAPIAGLSSADHVLCPLPLHHSYALDLCVLGVLAVGASERLLQRFSVHEVYDRLREERVSFLPGVPTMFQYLLESWADNGPNDTALRCCVSAGAIMPASLNQRFETEVAVPLLDGYGITETSTMVTMNWPTGTRVMGSCGLPLPGSAVRLVDPATGKDVPTGQEGEIWVRGPHVMLGYHDRPQDTAETITDGWYHTGDLGRLDPYGYLTISGRIKELIIRGGENIYPAEVETVLTAHASVKDAAVKGEPDPTLGEVPIAYVVPEDPQHFDPDALLHSCHEHLADFKIPHIVHTVAAIPRTGSGKIIRGKLAPQH